MLLLWWLLLLTVGVVMRRLFKRRKFLVAAVLAAVLAVFGSVAVPSGDTYADDAGAIETCASSGAAESLGWIVCPIMDMLGNASEGLYNGTVKQSLNVNPKLFTESGDDGARSGWSVFRDIANGFLIILFLVVIFSQLTGVGIDNYGIKKVLPKIIVAAILMNLSYWVCVIFVDLSNIVGNGIQSMFDGLANGLDFSVSSVADGDNVAEIAGGAIASGGATILSVAIIGALVAGGIWAVVTNPAILLGILIGAIGVVVSVFFLFILLAVREAAIVVLTVASPLAIACYMLPNTKKVFDRWLQLFEALLLVYPICGLLVGGGNYVSALLLKIGVNGEGALNIFSAITAMVVGIVPIFFFPTVLRKSLSGMGDIGAKITKMGNQVGGRLQGATQNSRAYQRAQTMGRERQTRFRAGLDKDGNLSARGQRRIDRINRLANGRLAQNRLIGGAVKGVAEGMTSDMADNRSQYLSDRVAQSKADRMVNGAGFDAAMKAQDRRAEGDMVNDYIELINDRTRNGEDETALLNEFDKYMAEGDSSGVVAVSRIAGRRKDTAARFAQARLTGTDEAGQPIAGSYNSDVLRAMAKEMSTGVNSGQYRSSSPLAFEFAAQLNRGEAGTRDYTSWLSDTKNADNAMNNYITNSAELVGMKGGSLEEVASMMKNGQMSEQTITRLRTLATDTIENRDKGPWDSTKAKQIADISGQYKYDDKTGNLVPIGEGAAAGGGDAGAAAAGAMDGGAVVGAAAAGAVETNGNTVQAPGVAAGNNAAPGGGADNSGELTIQHDDAPRAAESSVTMTETTPPVAASSAAPSPAPAVSAPATTAPVVAPAAPAPAASEVHSRAATAQQRNTPAQSRLEIAHSMDNPNLRREMGRVDAQNQGNRRWPGNPQTPRGI